MVDKDPRLIEKAIVLPFGLQIGDKCPYDTNLLDVRGEQGATIVTCGKIDPGVGYIHWRPLTEAEQLELGLAPDEIVEY
jgi:hypothetical protein